jgi:hypothetical protein
MKQDITTVCCHNMKQDIKQHVLLQYETWLHVLLRKKVSPAFQKPVEVVERAHIYNPMSSSLL